MLELQQVTPGAAEGAKSLRQEPVFGPGPSPPCGFADSTCGSLCASGQGLLDRAEAELIGGGREVRVAQMQQELVELRGRHVQLRRDALSRLPLLPQ